MIHELKIMTKYFEEVTAGTKTFEVRKNDRCFMTGDLLALNEYDGKDYTGKSCLVYVDYVLSDSGYCKEGYVIMTIKPCGIYRYENPFNPNKMCADYRVPIITREF